MKLERFRVAKFRSIMDSKWVQCDNITTLLGLNESGKSNLLLALLKFNPFNGDSRNLINQSDFPNNISEDYSEKATFIECDFLITDKKLINKLNENLDNNEKILNTENTIISKNYSGEYTIIFKNYKSNSNDLDAFNNISSLAKNLEKLYSDTIKRIEQSTANCIRDDRELSREEIIEEFNSWTNKTIEKINVFINEGSQKGTKLLNEVITSFEKAYSTIINPKNTYPKYYDLFIDKIKKIIDCGTTLLDKKNDIKNIKICEILLNNFPKFIYYYYSDNIKIPINLNNCKKDDFINSNNEGELIVKFFKFL